MNISRLVNFSSICTGCYACQSICPKNAINFEQQIDGFYYPYVNNELCSDCGLCIKVCTEGKIENPSSKALFYYGYAKDINYRLSGSSGGVFPLFASETIKSEGIVFGAYYDETTGIVKHGDTDNIELDKLLRSKYVQSQICDAFSKVKNELVKGRNVLFCGTPCQIKGLNSYLQKEYNNLITIDFVCHGVPSPGFFSSMVNAFKESASEREILNITFREKLTGWRNQNIVIYGGRAKHVIPSFDHPFYLAFVNNLILRKCCYTCEYTNNHQSDITLADYWGVDKSEDDDKGYSLISINTCKGREYFNNLYGKLQMKSINYDEVASLFRERKKMRGYSIRKRNSFLSYWHKNGYLRSIKVKFAREMLYKKIESKIIHLLLFLRNKVLRRA